MIYYFYYLGYKISTRLTVYLGQVNIISAQETPKHREQQIPLFRCFLFFVILKVSHLLFGKITDPRQLDPFPLQTGNHGKQPYDYTQQG